MVVVVEELVLLLEEFTETPLLNSPTHRTVVKGPLPLSFNLVTLSVSG